MAASRYAMERGGEGERGRRRGRHRGECSPLKGFFDLREAQQGR